MLFLAYQKFLTVEDCGDGQYGKRLINAQHIALHQDLLIVVQYEHHGALVGEFVKEGPVFTVFFPADEDVGVILALDPAFQFFQIPADAEGNTELADHVADTIFVALPHQGVFIFFHIDVVGREEMLFILDRDNGCLVQNFLRDGKLKFTAGAGGAVHGDEAAHAAD